MSLNELRNEWPVVDRRPVRMRTLRPAPGTDFAGLPLLWIHGLGCSSDAWMPSLRFIAGQDTGRTVLVPDMPGYGRSPGPKEALGIDDLAVWTERLLETVGVSCVHIAGNSMGCQVALALAQRCPERVGGMVLVGPPTGEHYESLPRYAVGLLRDGVHETLLYNGTMLRMYKEMGIPRFLATTRKMMEDDPFARAPEIAAPTLIVRGGSDGIIREPIARRLAAALPNGSYMPVDHLAHAIQYNNPDWFVPLALAFWERVEMSEASIARLRSQTTAAAVKTTT